MRYTGAAVPAMGCGVVLGKTGRTFGRSNWYPARGRTVYESRCSSREKVGLV